MTTFIDQIKGKIIKKLKPEKVLVIDNSNLHTKHKSFDPTKYHIKLIIKSLTDSIIQGQPKLK